MHVWMSVVRARQRIYWLCNQKRHYLSFLWCTNYYSISYICIIFALCECFSVASIIMQSDFLHSIKNRFISHLQAVWSLFSFVLSHKHISSIICYCAFWFDTSLILQWMNICLVGVVMYSNYQVVWIKRWQKTLTTHLYLGRHKESAQFFLYADSLSSARVRATAWTITRASKIHTYFLSLLHYI